MWVTETCQEKLKECKKMSTLPNTEGNAGMVLWQQIIEVMKCELSRKSGCNEACHAMYQQ